MKKYIIAILIVIILAVVGFIAFRWFTDNKNNNDVSLSSDYNASRISSNASNKISNDTTTDKNAHPTETELCNFSTDILTDSENRLTNIKITCSRINETVVKAGKEFSFCDVVGQPNSADGYKPADAFGANGEKIKAIGGGNCQVSTTIYNAVLKVDGLKVTERHEHSRDVAYIEDGKDATVAYDYLDLKFKNNNNFDVKLYCSVEDDKVRVKICKV